MCIPCVMCGACMASGNGEHADDDRCPECGEPVPNDAVSCPKCFTFLYRAPDETLTTARPREAGPSSAKAAGNGE